MSVKSFGYGLSTVVEAKGATDTFAVTWGVKMLNLRHHSTMRSATITHQVGRKCDIQTSRANSHPMFSKTITSEQRSSGKLPETVAGTGAHNAGSTSRPHAISAPMKWIVRHAAWLIPRFRRNDVQSLFCRAMGGPYRGKLLEFGESVFAHLPDVGKGSGNPARKLADRWNSSVRLGKSNLTDEHLVRTDERVVTRETCRAQLVRRKRPCNCQPDIPPAAEPLTLSHAPQEVTEDEKEEPTAEPEEDEEMQGEPSDTKETPVVSSSGRGEKRTETQENTSVKKRVMVKSPKRPATPVSPPDDPVKRRLLKKTDLKSDDVLMPVKIEDTDLLHTVNVLLNVENGQEAKPWSEELEKTKILTVLDDHEEMKGRQEELNSQKEMGAMTAVKRSEAVGKRVIQKRWVDREKDGRVKYSARDVFTNTIDTVSENNVGCKFT